MSALHSTSYEKFFQTPNILHFCRTEYLKKHFSLALLMNRMNLIMTSEVVVLKMYSVTLHEHLLALLQVKPRVLMCSLD